MNLFSSPTGSRNVHLCPPFFKSLDPAPVLAPAIVSRTSMWSGELGVDRDLDMLVCWLVFLPGPSPFFARIWTQNRIHRFRLDCGWVDSPCTTVALSHIGDYLPNQDLPIFYKFVSRLWHQASEIVMGAYLIIEFQVSNIRILVCNCDVLGCLRSLGASQLITTEELCLHLMVLHQNLLALVRRSLKHAYMRCTFDTFASDGFLLFPKGSYSVIT